MRLTIEIEVSDTEAPTSRWTEEDFDGSLYRYLDPAFIVETIEDRIFALNARNDDTGVEVNQVAIRNAEGQYWGGPEKGWVTP